MIYEIAENAPIARDIWKMRLLGDTSAISRPGQFAQIRVPGFYLPRPISLCDWADGEMTLVYRAAGEGTRAMTELSGQIEALPGLGNGYDTDALGDRPLLVGGGVGVPPLLALTRILRAKGRPVTVALGFRSRADAILVEEFAALGAEVRAATEDGSLGEKGFVTALLEGDFAAFACCGPEIMMKNVAAALDIPGQVSLEARMACGFGACMGCSREMRSGMKRVCADGPVFDKEDVIWQI